MQPHLLLIKLHYVALLFRQGRGLSHKRQVWQSAWMGQTEVSFLGLAGIFRNLVVVLPIKDRTNVLIGTMNILYYRPQHFKHDSFGLSLTYLLFQTFLFCSSSSTHFSFLQLQLPSVQSFLFDPIEHQTPEVLFDNNICIKKTINVFIALFYFIFGKTKI
jgi:hypothetical protein